MMRGLTTVCLFWIYCLFCSGAAQAQAVTNQYANPVSLYYYDGSSNLIYICNAESFQPVSTFPAGGTLTNVVVSSNTGTLNFTATSQLWVGARITLAGSATSALNGTYKILTVSGSTATITTSGVSNATYTDATLTTNAPLLNSLVWSIQAFTYTSTTLTGAYWAGPQSTAIPRGLACSARATY